MIFSPDNILIRKSGAADFDDLTNYLQQLSEEYKSRFGPHANEASAMKQFYDSNEVTGYIAIEPNHQSIIAYSIINKGMLDHDKCRLSSYHYPHIDTNCCTYAPSVSDNFQGKGIGKKMFEFIVTDCRQQKIERIILWGGVQNTNEKALFFYKKLGFKIVGEFEYNGINQDMIVEI